MRVLIVGAGAVGTSYGWALQRAGHEVSYFVRPHYADDVRAGLRLYDLRSAAPTTPLPVVPAAVYTEIDAVAAERFDVIIITVASPALRGAWFAPFLAASGDAAILALQPGLLDRELYLQHFREDRLIAGLITLIAYITPLPGETRYPQVGTALYLPPFTKMPLEGPADITDPLVAAFNAGGMPCRRTSGLAAQAGFASAMMNTQIIALELSGWSFAALRGSRALHTAHEAARQEIAIVAHKFKTSPPRGAALVRPWTMSLVTRVGPLLLPFDLEVYLKVHFSKVGDQTRAALQTYIDLGEAAGLPVDAVRVLAAGLDVTREAAA